MDWMYERGGITSLLELYGTVNDVTTRIPTATVVVNTPAVRSIRMPDLW